MEILRQFELQILAGLVTLAVGLIRYFFRPRSRLVYSSPHAFTFHLQPEKNKPGFLVYTASVWVSNNGAPNYLDRFGVPADTAALEGHRMIGLRATISVTGPESYLASARLGLGLVQVPRFHAEVDLERGSLVLVLPDGPPPSVPVALLHPRN
jgi:DNA-binding transcriptional LysR family regulator